MTISVGSAIYIGVKPLTKIFLNSAIGFYMGRKGHLTPETSQNISILVVNFLAPCLIFNKILSSIDTKDIVAIAVMLMTSFMYIAAGIVFALVVKFLTPNPKYWLGGLLTAGMFTNSGDMPIAYITSFVGGSTFSAEETGKGIAYCTIFLSNLSFCLYNLGCYGLISRDFKKEQQDKENGVYENVCESGLSQLLRKRKKNLQHSSNDIETQQSTSRTASTDASSSSVSSAISRSSKTFERVVTIPDGIADETHKSRNSTGSSRSIHTVHTNNIPELGPIMTTTSEVPQFIEPPKPSKLKKFFLDHHMSYVWEFLVNFTRPPSFSLLLSLLFTFIPPIRRLFYIQPDGIQSLGAGNIPVAPDGGPILGFIMDFTKFAGDAQVPLGLILLGGTVGRLEVKSIPKGFWKSALLMCLFKLVVLPIISVVWTNGMTSVGLIKPSNKIAQFVMILNSGVPTPTMTVYLTAIYSSASGGSSLQMDCVAIYLIMQYSLLVITMTILITYSITSVIHL